MDENVPKEEGAFQKIEDDWIKDRCNFKKVIFIEGNRAIDGAVAVLDRWFAGWDLEITQLVAIRFSEMWKLSGYM